MPKTLRYTLLSLREMLLSAGPFALLTVALLVLTYWWLDPNPPKRVVLATGPAQSAYDEFGKRYADALRRYGITVELLPTEGSSDNLELLRTGQAGLAPEEQVIRQFDIDAYKEKTELTTLKLRSVLYTSLRNYRALADKDMQMDNMLRLMRELPALRAANPQDAGLQAKALLRSGFQIDAAELSLPSPAAPGSTPALRHSCGP